MGSDNAHLMNCSPLDILRYAIKNEVRAKQFFRRKATTTFDPTQKMMYLAAVSDQEHYVRQYDAQRAELMQRQANLCASGFARAAV